tara:strand:+ start:20 stop:229 length:210 start_codon:yes stop_codon:yes gene_type:complete
MVNKAKIQKLTDIAMANPDNSLNGYPISNMIEFDVWMQYRMVCTILSGELFTYEEFKVTFDEVIKKAAS